MASMKQKLLYYAPFIISGLLTLGLVTCGLWEAAVEQDGVKAALVVAWVGVFMRYLSWKKRALIARDGLDSALHTLGASVGTMDLTLELMSRGAGFRVFRVGPTGANGGSEAVPDGQAREHCKNGQDVGEDEAAEDGQEGQHDKIPRG